MAAEAVTSAPAQPPLDDLMLAMDVVDTLRHGEAVAEREIAGVDRRARLIERLKEIYKAQGIAVPDRILADGVDALEQERFVYKPKTGGFAFTLARLYVRRGQIGRRVGIVAALVLAAFIGWYFLVQRPAAQRAEVARIELQETIPGQIRRLRDLVIAETEDPLAEQAANATARTGLEAAAAGNADAARATVGTLTTQLAVVRASERDRVELAEVIPPQIEALQRDIAAEARDPAVATAAAATAREGLSAATAGNAAAARAAVESLTATLNELRTVFEVRVVSRPGLDSGITRIPNDNPRAENAYLIVEAIGPGGRALTRSIVSEEEQRTRDVAMWGVRVPLPQFERVAADKRDDGIIQNAVVGRKARGDMNIQWVMPVSGGFITEWD